MTMTLQLRVGHMTRLQQQVGRMKQGEAVMMQYQQGYIRYETLTSTGEEVNMTRTLQLRVGYMTRLQQQVGHMKRLQQQKKNVSSPHQQ